jgi:hypothetical protein
MTAPELPEPSRNFGACEFTAAQMHAFYRQGMEAAAAICADRYDLRDSVYERIAAAECAAAIREAAKGS